MQGNIRRFKVRWGRVKYDLVRLDKVRNNLYNNRQEKINVVLQNTVKSKKPIQQFDKQNNLIQEFQSINEACRKLGIFKYPLSLCCNNRKKDYKDFIWKFKVNGSTTIS